MDDGLIQLLMRKAERRIDDLRTELETCTPEDLRHLQGQTAALREQLLIMSEQYADWLKGEDDAEVVRPPSPLELLLEGTDEA
jgi:hypothetical protein